MSKNINVPKLRFKEFSGEWEEKKLGNIANFYNSKRIPLTDSDRIKGIYPYYGASGIIDYVHDYIFDGEYILLGEDGANIVMRNSRLVFLAKGKFWLNNHAHIFQAKESNSFLCEALERINYTKYNTGTAQPKLNAEIVKKIKLNLPQKQEQEKIASFLTSIDTKIEQLTKKEELLQQYKKGVMQKIFNQEIRFKADDGSEFPEWEEKKLSDILDYIQPTKYLVKDTEYNNSFKIPVLTAGKTFILGYTDETDGIYKENLPVIIFDDFTTANRFVNFQFKVKSSAIKILVPKENNNIKFIYEAMQMIKYEVGGHERHWISKFSFLDIFVPCVEEQNKIANFLSSIDDKIEENQKILEKIKEFKKSLLQQMFV
ncbi:restriction endonuclease subunit S [Arcobacter lacus]|uniref:restriction endonuclease subunit S n=1 Tax=Arcobacter lacus TaxID=1912876 RepID=UPI0021BAFD18|nr:restriction endonuclease subunit S [Arcobacter lacus]MCT7911336.1 restriction endonuclease subunit S [Arcobacter lacus]